MSPAKAQQEETPGAIKGNSNGLRAKKPVSEARPPRVFEPQSPQMLWDTALLSPIFYALLGQTPYGPFSVTPQAPFL
jgi:hypothetical protein